MLQMILIMAIIHHFFCKWYRVDLIFLFRPHHEGEDKTPATDLSDACQMSLWQIWTTYECAFLLRLKLKALECSLAAYNGNVKPSCSCGFVDTWWRKWFSAGWRWMGGWMYQVMPESDNEEPPLSAHPSLPDPGWLLITFQFIIAVRPITG